MNLATTNIQPAFKNINGHLWSLMSMGLKTTGDYMKSLLYIEESLTFDEHETLYNFYIGVNINLFPKGIETCFVFLAFPML